MTGPSQPGNSEVDLSNPRPSDVANFHRQSDVNSSTLAQHHTLGIQPNQASPGDHSHNGVDSRELVMPEPPPTIPTGSITMYGGAAAPSGWVLCQGQSLPRAGTYAALFAVIGTAFGAVDASSFNVPDLRNNFPVGAGSTYGLNAKGGATAVTLTSAEMPSHSHANTASSSSAGDHGHSGSGSSDSQGWHGHTGSTSSAGSHSHVEKGVNTTSGQMGGGAIITTVQSITSPNTGSAGDHSHSVSIDGNGSHGHNISVSVFNNGSHGHTITLSNAATGGGGSHENRPPYIGLNFIIKA